MLLALFSASVVPLQTAMASGYVWTRTVTMMVPAVARTETGYIGVMSKLVVTVAAPGSGIVYVSADPLTELDMQAAARMAALVAATVTGYDYYGFDYFIRIESNTSIVGGPSASGAMAVAIIAALRGTEVRKDFSMTGMIDPDATLGPVGGIPEKLLAAAESGVRVFVIPVGQEKALDLNTGAVIDVIKLGAEKGVKVVVAKTILDAYAAATGDKAILDIVALNLTPQYPVWLRDSLMKTAETFRKLAEGNMTCAESLVERLPATARHPFTVLLEAARTALSQGDTYYAKGLYYSAASRFFSSAITATKACLMARLLLADNPVRFVVENVSRYIAAANATLNVVEPTLRGLLYRTSNTTDVGVQLAVATLIRINDARESLSAAASLVDKIVAGRAVLNLDLVSTLLDEAIYSYYRAMTARQWLGLFRSYEGGTVVTSSRLRSAAYMLAYFAQSTASYSTALGIPVTQAASLLDHAKLVLARANTTLDYIEALVYAIRSYTLTTTHLRAAMLTGNESITAAREGLAVLASLAREKGLQPILPSLYLEYGDTLNGTAALQLYVQGASYALLLNTLVPGKKINAKPFIATSTITKTIATTVVKTITVTVTGGGGEKTVTKVPVTVTATGTVTEKTVTLEKTKTITSTTTVVKEIGASASWPALFLTAAIALLAGILAGRAGRG